MRTVKLLGVIALWMVQILAALAFVLIGVAKFGDPSWAHKFARWGYPDGFYMVIGALEALGGLCLLVPRVASYAAVLLGIIMLGASATHFLHAEMGRVAPPLMFLALLVIIGFGRRKSAVRLAAMTGRSAVKQPV